MKGGKYPAESIPQSTGSSWVRRHPLASILCAALAAAVSFSTPLAAQQPSLTSEQFLERLEWRGVMALAGEVRFSLHDKNGQGGFWIGPGEVRSGVEVVTYDPDENVVTLRHGEATRTLSMSTATVVALREISPPAPPRVPNGAPPLPSQSPLDEATRERLDALWQQAMEQSFNVSEINQAARTLNRDKSMIDEAIAMSPPENPQLEELVARQNELRQRERELAEGALAELQNIPGGAGPELNAGLLGGYLSSLEPAPQPDRDAQDESVSDEP